MNAKRKARQRTAKRSRVLAVLLLAFIYVGQPALAFVAAGSVVAPCQADGADCCCAKKVETPAPAKSCCSSKEASSDEREEEKECDCRVAAGELPAQDPALPLQRNSNSDDSAFGEWIRIHSEASAVCSSRCPVPSVRDGTAEPVPRLELTRQVSSVQAWTLMTRGVAGFLAVLSVARV